jgi:hypothetical protein
MYRNACSILAEYCQEGTGRRRGNARAQLRGGGRTCLLGTSCKCSVQHLPGSSLWDTPHRKGLFHGFGTYLEGKGRGGSGVGDQRLAVQISLLMSLDE